MASQFRGPGGPDLTPPLDLPNLPANMRPYIIGGVALVGLIALFILLNWLRGVYTDFLWFGELDFSSVYRTILVTRIWLFFTGALLFAAIASGNIYLTYRFGGGPQVAPMPEETLKLLRPLVLAGVVFVIFVASLIFGGVAGGHWETVLTFMNSTSFGIDDPQFSRDVSFYVFKLPLLQLIQGWLLGAVIVTLLFTVGMYFVHFSLRGAVFSFTTPVLIHISVLGALLLFIFGFGYYLSVFNLVFSDRGAVVGAAYTDVKAGILSLRILMAVVFVGGLLLLVNPFVWRRLALIVAVLGLWIIFAIGVGAIYPAVVQRVRVNPNELRREIPYIQRNIESTRAAFGLDRIVAEDYPLATEGAVTQSLVNANLETVNNIRLWDHRPFLSVLNQIQFFRLYYTFPSADVDRYLIEEDGQTQLRQVMLGTRELDSENLPVEAQSWVNRKLQFTHGYGAVMAPVTEFTTEGHPVFLVKDLPPSGSIPVDRPEVYYGETGENFVIVNSKQLELDYEPEVGDPIYAAYEGEGGVRLGGFFRRVAYAWQFQDFNVLVSGEVTSGSRIQYHRNIQERISKVAPFLKLDDDPYIVVSEGRLFWIQDAYTVTSHYPYSTPLVTPFGELNYIRNSVKVVLDAYSGTLDFYVTEPEDPIIITYQEIFPDLFRPLDQMPEDLRDHMRYPQDLFRTQALQYLTYHMTDPNEFFNKADQWSIPQEFFQGTFQTMEPYFLNMRLPGEEQEEFVLLLPFTPSERDNMVGWLAARSDGEFYGTLLSFAFPKGVTFFGPSQVEARISTDEDIKEFFALRCTGEASCIRGNLLVIPMEGEGGNNQILYAEPLYLQATGLAFPELKKVILADNSKVVMEDTLDEAIAALTGGVPALASRPPPQGPAETPPTQPQPGPAPSLPSTVQEEAARISEALEGVLVQLEILQKALERLQELGEGS